MNTQALIQTTRASSADQLKLKDSTRLDYIRWIIRERPGSILAQYMVSLPSDRSRETMFSRLQRVATLLGYPINEIKWETLSFKYLKIIVELLSREGKEEEDSGQEQPQKRPLKTTTINLTLVALKGIAKQAWLLGRMKTDNYLRIREVKNLIGSHIPKGRALTVVELALLLDSCAEDRNETCGDRDACLIALLAAGGLRRAEAMTLKVSDYDRQTHALKVTGKRNKQRYVFFDEGGARRAIETWLKRLSRTVDAHNEPLALRGQLHPERTPLLAPITRGGRVLLRGLTEEAIYKALRARAAKAGVEPFSPHDLRRTFGTELLDLGADISVVKRLMGHSRVESTSTYDHRREEASRRAQRKLKFPYRPRSKRRKGRRRGRTRRPSLMFM